jgi:molybdate transport system regulatory protein
VSRDGESATDRLVVRARAWIEHDGRPVIGPGRAALLEAVDRLGSLAGAAREAGVGYRTAWGWLARMNAAAGVPLVQGRHGGSERGGSALTPAGRALVRAFRSLEAHVKALEREGTAALVTDLEVQVPGRPGAGNAPRRRTR